jgi:hypothetical protein
MPIADNSAAQPGDDAFHVGSPMIGGSGECTAGTLLLAHQGPARRGSTPTASTMANGFAIGER